MRFILCIPLLQAGHSAAVTPSRTQQQQRQCLELAIEARTYIICGTCIYITLLWAIAVGQPKCLPTCARGDVEISITGQRQYCNQRMLIPYHLFYYTHCEMARELASPLVLCYCVSGLWRDTHTI